MFVSFLMEINCVKLWICTCEELVKIAALICIFYSFSFNEGYFLIRWSNNCDYSRCGLGWRFKRKAVFLVRFGLFIPYHYCLIACTQFPM